MEKKLIYFYTTKFDVIEKALDKALNLFYICKFISNENDFQKEIEIKIPEIIIFNSINEKLISNSYELKSSKTRKPIIIGLEYFKGSLNNFFEYGGDYIINIINPNLIITFISKMEENKEFTEEEKKLVKSREQFYKEHVNEFDLRSKITSLKKDELSFIIPLLKTYQCKTILDSGCGNGRLTLPLSKIKFNMFGIDINKELIEIAIKKSSNLNNKPNFVRGNILKTPFEKNSFDAILLMWHMICEVREYKIKLLKESHRILKIGGLIIFDIPFKSTNKDYDSFVPTLEEISNEIKIIGFKLILVSTVI